MTKFAGMLKSITRSPLTIQNNIKPDQGKPLERVRRKTIGLDVAPFDSSLKLVILLFVKLLFRELSIKCNDMKAVYKDEFGVLFMQLKWK